MLNRSPDFFYQYIAVLLGRGLTQKLSCGSKFSPLLQLKKLFAYANLAV